jgi:hypothetical protein
MSEPMRPTTTRRRRKAPAISGVHPYALLCPRVNADALTDWADDIKRNGLREPIVVTPAGLIIDGINRNEACKLAGVDPTVEVFEGDDHAIARYIQSANIFRRNMTPGQRAMSNARILHADGCRVEGRWARGAVVNPDPGNPEFGITGISKTWQNSMSKAGIILDHAPELAESVAEGGMSLDKAFLAAEERRDPKKKKTPKPKPTKPSGVAVQVADTRMTLEKVKAKQLPEAVKKDLVVLRRVIDRILSDDVNGTGDD